MTHRHKTGVVMQHQGGLSTPEEVIQHPDDDGKDDKRHHGGNAIHQVLEHLGVAAEE